MIDGDQCLNRERMQFDQTIQFHQTLNLMINKTEFVTIHVNSTGISCAIQILQAVSPSSSPKTGFWGEANFETKSGKGRRNSGTDYSCLEFTGGFNCTKTGFLSPTVREIFVNENGKNREI